MLHAPSLDIDGLVSLTPLQDKREVISELMVLISQRKHSHYKRYKCLQHLQNVVNTMSFTLQTFTTTTIFVVLQEYSEVFVYLGVIFSTLCLILQSLRIGYKLDEKLSRFHVSQNQYEELLRSVNLTLARNNLNNSSMISLISEINMLLSLIQDSSIE